MGQLFISSKGAVRRPGVFALEVAQPRTIRGASLGRVGLVAKFAWGPIVQDTGVGYTPESGQDFMDKFEPVGSPRTSSGWLAVLNRKKSPWHVAGIKGSGYAKATLSKAGTAGNIVATARYFGVLGNSILWTQQAASNGDATARDHVFTLTDPNGVSGTLTETFKNVAMNATIDCSKSLLLGSLVFSGGTMTAWAANFSNTALASGSDGAAIAAADYQTGLDALALESTVKVVVTDDCGDSVRTAVNTNVANHLANNTDRVGAIMGPAGNTWAQAKTDKATYTAGLGSMHYFANWGYTRDAGGTLRQSPPSTAWATARVSIDRFVSASWRDPDSAANYYDMFESVTTNFAANSETVQDEGTDLGINFLMPNEGPGGYVPCHDRTMSLVSGKLYMTTRWYKNWLTKSLVAGLPTYVNGPNMKKKWTEIKGLVDAFLEAEKDAGALVEDEDNDGNVIPAYSTDYASVNTKTTRDQGEFSLAIDGKNPSVLERLFLLMNVGENVTVRDPSAGQ
jgi:hypothetical protein